MAGEFLLKRLSDTSFDVQFEMLIPKLSSLFGIAKKDLRKAFRVRRTSELEEEIIVKGKHVKMTFHSGFRKFFIQEPTKKREILAPHPNVQKVLDAVGKWLTEITPDHPRQFGFVKKRDPKKALQHLLPAGKHYFSFDIKDCFPSINITMAMALFESLQVEKDFVMPLGWFVTYYHDLERRLPQGSPCSPAILNRVYKPMCREIQHVCKKHGIKKWIIYADDITCVSDEISQDAKDELLAIPAKFGFSIKEKKTRDNKGKHIPHILGMTVVNGKIHLPRAKKKEYRRILFEATKFGSHSKEKVLGILSHINQVYGGEDNWPGWLLKPTLKYNWLQMWKKEVKKDDKRDDNGKSQTSAPKS